MTEPNHGTRTSKGPEHDYYSNDYDYIGAGDGFLIECSDGQVLGVTEKQAKVLTQNCEFFRNCFKHGTVETQHNLLRKPDWSLEIARHIAELVVKGCTTLATLELYSQFMEATDQALLDVRLCSFVNYMDPFSVGGIESHHRFLELINPQKYRFKLKGSIKSEQWIQLLANKGILLNREETNYVCKLHKANQVPDRDRIAARRKLDTKVSEYLVHADRTISAILEIEKMLEMENTGEDDLDDLENRDEQFSIYFETTQPIPREQHELIDRLAGGEAYIRTCADAAEYKTEGYTVQASFDVLKRAIEPLCCMEDNSANTSPTATEESNIDDSDAKDATKGTGDDNGGDPDGNKEEHEDIIAGSGIKPAPATTPPIRNYKFEDNKSNMIHCSLRVDNPTPDTLGRFINACQHAQDYPSTLGLDAATNRYFCRKTVRDIHAILVYMSDYSTSSKIQGDFTLYELSSEDQAF